MRKFRPLPSTETIRNHFNYDSNTGLLTLRVDTSRRKTGDEAGLVVSDGYRKVSIEGIQYPAHRVIYCHFHGIDPEEMQVDHKNGNRLDNRIENLRLATHAQNLYNQIIRKDSITGIKGVSFDSKSNRWKVKFTSHRKSIWVGSFATKEEAVEASQTKRIELHGDFANHGNH